VPPNDRTAEVWRAVALVTDPELDQSIVDLGFVSAVTVAGDRVALRFRLPTFWCSASFAWIMAEDMRAALAEIPWLAEADIRLVDHFAAGKINRGIAAGDGFQAAFGAEAAGDLAALRQTFRRKAYLGRMSRLIEALRDAGWADAEILAIRVADLSAPGDPRFTQPMARYRELRAVYGGRPASDAPAFTTLEGNPIAPAALPAYLRDIRMTRRGVEANGEMCRVLLRARMESALAIGE
jgi:metal-sulfur cluster biosynthetic enzyme